MAFQQVIPPSCKEGHSACLGLENRSWEGAEEGGEININQETGVLILVTW